MADLRQKKLFEDAGALGGEQHADFCANVVFNRPMRMEYTYLIPKHLADRMEPGKRVLAPFGRGGQRTTGFCVGIKEGLPADLSKYKSIQSVVDEIPLLTPKMLELARWMSRHYFCGLGQVLDGILPKAVKSESGTRWAIFVSAIEAALRPVVELTAKQRRAFDAIVELGKPITVKEAAEAGRCGAPCIKALKDKGWIKFERRRVVNRTPKQPPVLWDTPPTMNADQRGVLAKIIEAIESNIHQTFVLHGVTGSGKTEVYLQAIADCIRRSREAIVLVPEISLTPQTIQRFRQRFDHVAVLHSQLSDAERNWHWKRIARGEIQVIVGARSALFAPCRNLGLIVIDEEHEGTFKQESTPRYHARDVAIERSRIESIPVILGTATPSLESWHATQTGKAKLLSLPFRVANQQMPRVQLIDLRDEFRHQGKLRAISRTLATLIEQTVKSGGQVILLLNRRGFSTTILCPLCGKVEVCPHCEIALTFHRELNRLLCHSCDAEVKPIFVCSQCKKPSIRYAGIGTERVEEEVRERFPTFTCARMDSDTMRSASHYENILNDFRNNKIQILLGTQMIAKGLDFPNVHLVGVISADTARNIPDFRASERTFQLIAQVAGRTGRSDVPGKVIVQTFNPDDLAILAASRHDYLAFTKLELPVRADFGYPPYTHLTRIILRSKDLTKLREGSALMARRLEATFATSPDTRILGPAVPMISRLQDYHRMHFQIHTPLELDRCPFLEQTVDQIEMPGDVEFVIDVDPMSLL